MMEMIRAAVDAWRRRLGLSAAPPEELRVQALRLHLEERRRLLDVDGINELHRRFKSYKEGIERS